MNSPRLNRYAVTYIAYGERVTHRYFSKEQAIKDAMLFTSNPEELGDGSITSRYIITDDHNMGSIPNWKIVYTDTPEAELDELEREEDTLRLEAAAANLEAAINNTKAWLHHLAR